MHVFFNTSVQVVGEAWDEHIEVELFITGPRTMPLYYEFLWYRLRNKVDVTYPYGSNEWIFDFKLDPKAQLLGEGLENITMWVRDR